MKRAMYGIWNNTDKDLITGMGYKPQLYESCCAAKESINMFKDSIPELQNKDLITIPVTLEFDVSEENISKCKLKY